MPLHKPGQLLLANLLVMRQPVTIPTKEWIDKILQYLTKGPKPTTASVESRNQYLHAVSSWTALYKREHGARETLENEVFQLQQEIEHMKEQLNEDGGSGNNSKRKRISDGSSLSPVKKLRANSSQFGHQSYLDATSKFKDCPVAGEECRNLLRHLYDLFIGLQEETLNAITIAPHIALTAAAAAAAVTSFCQKHDRYLGTSTGTFGPVLAANHKEAHGFFQGLVSIAILLLQSIDAMDVAVPEVNSIDTSYTGAAVYEIARLFRSILACLASACSTIAEYEILPKHPSNDQTIPSNDHISPSKTAQSTSTPTKESISSLPEKLQQLLRDILTYLTTPLDPPHSSTTQHSSRPALLEALTYLLLTRAGDHLHLFTFSNPDTPDTPNPPEPTTTTTTTAQRIRAAELESERLLPLLSHAIRATEATLRCTAAPSDSSSAVRTGASALLAGPRAALQRTLLRGVFGKRAAEEPLARGWGAGVGGLRMPARPAKGWLERAEKVVGRSAVRSGDGNGRAVRDRFVCEMWALCGWGILGGVFEGEG